MRADRFLLSPVRHRGIEAQADRMGIRVRALVELRTKTVNAVRGLVKPFGQRLQACDTGNLGPADATHLDAAIRGHAERLLRVVEELTKEIDACDRELTLDDPARFGKSRDAGCFPGLRPSSRQSGASDRRCGSVKKATAIYARCRCSAGNIF